MKTKSKPPKNRLRKVTFVEYSGYHAVYPGQTMLEKRNADKSKTSVTWADIIPDQTYKTGNWKITVEFQSKHP